MDERENDGRRGISANFQKSASLEIKLATAEAMIFILIQLTIHE